MYQKFLPLFAAFALLWQTVAWAQVQPVNTGYTFASSSGTYTPITGGTAVTTTAGADDNVFGPFNIGFPFYYSDVTTPFTQFSLNANGFIGLGATPVTSSYTSLSTGAANNVIAGFNQDLQTPVTPANGDISYVVTGTAPFRTLTVQWTNFRRFATTVGDNFNFQIRLSETTNVVEVVFGTVSIGGGGTTTLQSGLRGSAATVFNNRTTTTDWAATTAGATNAASLALSATVFPASGQTFTWNPTCLATNAAGTFTLSPTALCASSANVLLTSSGYSGIVDFQTSTDGGATWANTAPTNQTSAATNVTQTIAVTAPSTQIRAAVSCGGITSFAGPETFTLSAPAATSITASSAGPFCNPPGANTDLTVTSDPLYTFLWSTSATTATITVTPTATTTYTVTATDGTCTATANYTVTVTNAPVVTAVANPSTVCQYQNVTLYTTPSPVLITEVTAFRTGTGATAPYPAFLAAADDDFIEISNIANYPANIGGMVVDIWIGTALSRSWPVPSGTVIPANGVLILHIGTGTDSPANNYYHSSNGGTGLVTNNPLGSATLVGILIRNGSTIVDAVAVNNYAWPVASNVAAQGQWSGTVPSSSGRAGINRTGATDTNVAADWVVSNTPSPLQTIGTLNSTLSLQTYSFLWSTGATTGSTIDAPSIAGTTNYTVTVTASGCSATSTVSVTVNPASASPTADVITTICGTQSVNFTATSATTGTFRWYATAVSTAVLETDAATTAASYTASVSTPGGSYWVDFTEDGSSCASARVEVSVISTAPEAISISSTNGDTFCSVPGASTDLTVTTTYPTITWSPATGLNTTTGTTVTATPTATTTYTVTSTDGTCTATASYTITVNPSPTGTATATPSTICSAEATNLGVSFAATPPAYCAAAATSTVDDDIASVTFGSFTNNSPGWPGATISNPGSTGTYTDYTALAPGAYIPGNAYTLSVTQYNSGVTFYACYYVAYFDWNQDGDFADAGETFDLGTTVFGVPVDNVRTLSVTIPATATPGSTRMRIVQRESATLATTLACGTFTWGEVEDYTILINPYTYTWSATTTGGVTTDGLPPSAATPLGTNIALAANPVASGSNGTAVYTVVITDAVSGCTATSDVTVNVTSPEPAPFAQGSTQCGTTAANLQAASIGGVIGTFVWYDAATGGTALQTDLNAISSVYAPVIGATANYWVDFTANGSLCPSPRTQATATVFDPLPMTITASNPGPFCSNPGANTLLTANTTYPTITWSPASYLSSASGATVTATPVATTTYTVAATDGTCTATASITITVTPSPSLTASSNPSNICSGTPVVLTGSASSGPGATYCAVSVGSSVDDDIASVTLGTFTNDSPGWPGAATGNTGSNAQYTDYTAINIPAVLPGSSYPVSVTQYNSAGSYGCFVSVFIDWNQNGILNDADEVFHLGATSAGTSAVGTIAVPAGALPGKTRCRVYLRESGSAATNEPCTAFTWGEVEDYSIFVSYEPQYAWSVLSTTGDAAGALPPTAGTPLASNTTVSVSPTATITGSTITYQVVTTDPGTGCTATAQTVVTVSAGATPPAANPSFQCGQGQPTLVATSTILNGTFNWYDTPTATTPISVEITTAGISIYTAPLITTTTTYYVEFVEAGNPCPSTRTPVVANVIAAELITITSDPLVPDFCSSAPQAVTLTVASNDPGYIYTWSPNAGLFTDLALTTPYDGTGSVTTVYCAPTATITYNVSGTSGICNATASTTITVSPSPVATATATPSIICGGGSTLLSAAPPAPVFCTASATSTVDDDIASVTFGSFTNNSPGWPGVTVSNPGSTGLYNDYTALAPSTYVPGNTYTLSVTQYNSGVTFYGCYHVAYFDWNQDGDFADADEKIDVGGTAFGAPANNVLTTAVTIPATALAGRTRMRIVQVESGSFASVPSCGTFTWGEVEDYTIVVNFEPAYAWTIAATTGDAIGNLPPTASTPLATNANVTSTATATTGGTVTYLVTVSDPLSGCTSTAQTIVAVNPVPAAPTVSDAAYCGADLRSMTATSAAAGIFNWYNVATGGTSLLTEGSEGSPLTSSTYTTPAPTTVTYWVDVTVGGCVSTRSAVTLTISVADPVTITPSSTAAICQNSGASVILTASSLNTNYVYTWLQGITPIGTGSSVSVTPNITTTYTLSGFDAGTNCSGLATYTVTVTAAPTVTASGPVAVCTGDNAVLQALPSGYSLTSVPYFAVTAPGTVNAGPIGDDIMGTTNPIGFNFNLFGTVYTQFAIATNGNIQLGAGPYNAALGDVPIPNVATPNAMIALAWDDWNSAAGGLITWWVTGAPGSQQLVVDFTNVPRFGTTTDLLTGQIILQEGSNNIYLSIFNQGSLQTATQGIEDGTGAQGVAIPGRNSQIWTTSTPNTYLLSATAFAWSVLSTTGDAVGGLPPGAGTQSASNTNITAVPTATLGGTVTYQASITDPISGCVGTSNVTVAVNPLPNPPIVAPPAICGAGSAALLAMADAPGGIIQWYDAATGGTLLQTDGASGSPVTTSTYNTPVITATTDYYVQVTNANGCISSRRTVTVVVSVADAITISTTPDPATYCSGSPTPITLTAASINPNYAYTWSDGVATVGTGASIIVMPTASTTYTVTGFDVSSNCSNIASTTVTVNLTPTVTVSTTDNDLCNGENSTLTAVINGGSVVNIAPGTPTYCAGTASSSAGDFIANVTLGSINNTSIETGAPTYYNDFTAQSTTLASGGTYTISLQVGTWATAQNYIGAWIDYNNNGVFTDPGEEVGLSGALIGSAIYTNTFTVPTIAGSGTVRMRVREVYFAVSTPCGNSGFGETEDYSINLTGASYTFAWSNGATTVGQTITPPLGSNTYTVSVTSNGCTATASSTITVNPIPAAAVSPTSAAISCLAPSTLLTASGGGTYLWSNGSTTDAITAIAPGTYTVTVTGTGNCTATASAVVTGSVTPPNVNAGPDRVVTCTNPIATLSGSSTTPNAMFAWSNGASTATTTATLAGTYTVTVTDPATNCTATDSAVVTANQTAPNLSVLPTSATLTCSTTSVALTASSTTIGTSFAWSTGATTAGITATLPNTYTVTVTSAINGCTSTASVVVGQDITPPVANAGADFTLTCSAQTTVIGTTAVGGSSYAWSPSTGLSATDIAQPTASASGTYTVTVTGANGCTSTDDVTIGSDVSAPIFDLGVDQVITCNTPSYILTATGGGTYAWSTGATSASVTASTAGTYSVTVTGTNGCTASDNVTLTTDNAAPVFSLGADQTLTCTTTSYALTASGGGTYAWSTGQSTTSITVNTAGNYSVTVTGTNGCTASDAVAIGINTTPPTVSISGLTDLCAGTTLSLTATGGGTYAWSGPGSFTASGATMARTNTTLAMAGTYTVTVTSANGCTATASTVVTITQCCSAEGGVIAAANTLCPGDPIVATVSGQNTDGVNYAFYYLLVNPATGAIVASNTTGSFAGITPGSYAVYGYSVKTSVPVGGPNPPANGTLISAITGSCFDLSNTGTTVNVPQPIPPFVGNISASQGDGGTTPFSYNIQVLTLSGGTLPYNFSWDNTGYVRYDIQYSGNGATVTIYYADNANWACTVTDSNNCGAGNLSFTNVPGTATTNPIIDIDSYVITPQSANSVNGAINITVSGGGCTTGQYTYQWSGPNSFSATTEDVSGLVTGWYSVTATCPLTGQTTTGWYWVPKSRRGRGKIDGMIALTVAPNPFQTATQIEFVVPTTGNTTVAVFGIDGKQVAELYSDIAQAEEVYTLPFSGDNLAAGVYLVKVTTESGDVQTTRMVVTK